MLAYGLNRNTQEAEVGDLCDFQTARATQKIPDPTTNRHFCFHLYFESHKKKISIKDQDLSGFFTTVSLVHQNQLGICRIKMEGLS